MAKGTTSAGRDGSSGVAMSRSPAMTWSPAPGSSPNRSRASVTRASSTSGLAGETGDDRLVAFDRGGVLLRLIPVGEEPRSDRVELAPFRCPLLLVLHEEEVLPVVGDRHDRRRLADRGREDRVGHLLLELAPGDPAEVTTVARLSALGEVFRDVREGRLAGIDLGLQCGEVRRVVEDLDDVIPEFGLDRRQQLPVGRLRVEDRFRERLDIAAVAADVGVQDAAGAIRPAGAL